MRPSREALNGHLVKGQINHQTCNDGQQRNTSATRKTVLWQGRENPITLYLR